MKNMPVQYMPGGKPAPRFQDTLPRNTNRTATAILSTHVEILRMSPTAFWISTSILAWLVVTIVIFATVQRRYFGSMQRNVECIADVLVLIAGSERLLAIIREKGIETIVKEDSILTRLGWFRDPDGTMRWRIELVDDKEVQMQRITLGAAYARVPEDDDRVVESGAASPRASLLA
ncbi:hypothetical protein EKO04_007782 [Ascochyta lentis]|uniref:Uncharacterized protein n=1 Tax=Ascochyta lentis TaxID=205686 RepID=A0A8H7J1P4_9PLEO|nr:hypothetical protein EKO04_007782 [Ascochyta lentis]